MIDRIIIALEVALATCSPGTQECIEDALDKAKLLKTNLEDDYLNPLQDEH